MRSKIEKKQQNYQVLRIFGSQISNHTSAYFAAECELQYGLTEFLGSGPRSFSFNAMIEECISVQVSKTCVCTSGKIPPRPPPLVLVLLLLWMTALQEFVVALLLLAAVNNRKDEMGEICLIATGSR
jgi:hypothetical protein